MRRLLPVTLTWLALNGLPVAFAQAELLVIVHPSNPVGDLKRHQVVDIYMGRRLSFADGRLAFPVDQAPDSPARQAFYQRLIGKTVAQVNAYWARLLFTGRATPPRVLPSPTAVLRAVQENPQAIAYIEARYLETAEVPPKIVYRVE